MPLSHELIESEGWTLDDIISAFNKLEEWNILLEKKNDALMVSKRFVDEELEGFRVMNEILESEKEELRHYNAKDPNAEIIKRVTEFVSDTEELLISIKQAMLDFKPS